MIETSRLAFCKVGVYKGNIVAIKTLNKRSVDLTRNIRKELKQVGILVIKALKVKVI